MFCNTFGISEKRIRTVFNLVTDTGATMLDGRGRHDNHKTAEARELVVMEHIKLC